jgi:hypothetical protein
MLKAGMTTGQAAVALAASALSRHQSPSARDVAPKPKDEMNLKA